MSVYTAKRNAFRSNQMATLEESTPVTTESLPLTSSSTTLASKDDKTTEPRSSESPTKPLALVFKHSDLLVQTVNTLKRNAATMLTGGAGSNDTRDTSDRVTSDTDTDEKTSPGTKVEGVSLEMLMRLGEDESNVEKERNGDDFNTLMPSWNHAAVESAAAPVKPGPPIPPMVQTTIPSRTAVHFLQTEIIGLEWMETCDFKGRKFKLPQVIAWLLLQYGRSGLIDESGEFILAVEINHCLRRDIIHSVGDSISTKAKWMAVLVSSILTQTLTLTS